MAENKLKPCCCGATNEVQVIRMNSLYWVECAMCGEETDVKNSRAEAIEAWNKMNNNRRANDGRE